MDVLTITTLIFTVLLVALVIVAVLARSKSRASEIETVSPKPIDASADKEAKS